jgi:hypothetical protein
MVHSPIILVHKSVESLGEFKKTNEKPYIWSQRYIYI